MKEIDETIETYDTIAPEYCKRTRQAKFLEWEDKYIKKLLYYIDKSNPLILDPGCGDGRHCRLIERSGGSTIGIDLSNSMIEESRKSCPDGDFRKMDMRSLDFDDDMFDGIWSSGSIYHVPKSSISEVLEEFARVSKADGVFALNFKLGTGEGVERDTLSYSGLPRYFAYYSEKEMVDLAVKAGFEKLDSEPFPEDVFGDSILQMWFRLR